MNKSEIILICKKELALKRAKAQNKAYLNLINARKNETFVELEKKEKNLVFEIGKLKAFNMAFSTQQDTLNKILKEKELILTSMGLTSQSLFPLYECEKCHDIGYSGANMCSCLTNMINNYIIKNAGSGKTDLASFDNFNASIAKTEEQKTQLLKLRKKFEQFIENYPLNIPHFMVISGPTGVGKTFITECFTTEIIKKGYLTSFISAFGMNNLFVSYHTSFDNQKSTYLNSLLDPDVLVIDDLGTEPILKNVTLEYLYLILSERSRLNKLTIITTNLQPKEIISRYNERIFSRLFNKRESFLASMTGSDLRLSSK